MKKYIKKIFWAAVRLLAYRVYDQKHFTGKYFEKGQPGWGWVKKSLWTQKFLRINKNIPFPIGPNIHISNYKNLILGKNNLNNFQSFGIYFQNFSAKIILGDEVFIAPNVGIITTNHDVEDLSKHLPGKDVVIGSFSWIGMNSVIMPGVVLGERTIVGAGSIVTKSFEEGNVVIAGNPAKIIKNISS